MMTKERALYILKNRKAYGELKFRFQVIVGNTDELSPDGITFGEHRYIKSVWSVMPGHTCYLDAIIRIAKGKVPNEIRYC